MTNKERIQIRDFLNRFSDRWPEKYDNLYHKFDNHLLFNVCILWQLIQMDTTLDAIDIGLIQYLAGIIEIEAWQEQKQTKTKITLEEITDGKL